MASERKILRVLDALTALPESSVEALMPASLEHRNNITTIIESKNVLAVGISEKISKNRRTGKLALTFYVEKKVPLRKLKGTDVIPPTIPGTISGRTVIVTDVVEIGKLVPEVNATRRTFQPGNSIGHRQIEAGTFGAVVKDKKNNLFILSNSHVLADSGFAQIGDDILYPGAYDSGASPTDVRAKLHKFIPFDTSKNFPNLVDCAIAKPIAAFLPGMIAEIKGVGLPKGIIKPKRGMKVVKVGRTSGKTVGEITDVNFRAMIDYRKAGMSDLRFRDQIWCKKKYTKPGDSGSLVLDRATGKAVGLHFAGAKGGSAHNRIDDVLAALKVTLVTSTAAAKKKTGKKKKKTRSQ